MKTRLNQSRRLALSVLAVAALTAIMSGDAFAEPMKTLLSSGPSANRVDIVLLGDGYTAGQMANYASDVTAIAARMFDQDPFRSYHSYFNVHYVDVVSAESGADHPSRGIYATTALGAMYDCADIQRLICVDTTAVENVLARSVKADQRDVVIVVVNDSEYGGSGGWFAVTSMHGEATEIVLHEVGHSFGLLADEYAYADELTCANNTEPEEPNVTIARVRSAIKWATWIDPATPVPTQTTNEGEPGLYERAKYCASGMYRATYDSKMRSLGRPYDQINTEQLVTRIYNLVSPIDQIVPATAVVKASSGQTVEFRIKPLVPASHRLEVLWSVDGQSMSTASRYLLATGALAPGDHTVLVTVRDSTPFVRNDRWSVLEDSRSWTLRIAARTVPSVRVVTPNGGEYLAAGMPTTVKWDASDPDGLRRFDVSLSLDGTSFTAIPGCAGLAGPARSCTWTPTTTGLKAWIRVAAIDTAGAAGQDASDRPFSLETQARIVLERLAALSTAIEASDFRKKRPLESRLARAIAAEQHSHPRTMCRQLRLIVQILEKPSVRRIGATTALRREARKAVTTLGCSAE